MLNNPLKSSVLVAFPSMKKQNTGFYHFGKSFGHALLKKNKDFDLTYYLPQIANAEFLNKVTIIKASPLHKLFFCPRNRFKLVHHTDQLCELSPNQVKGKKILTIHDLNFLHQTPDNVSRIKRYLNKVGKNIYACDQIVTISHFVKNEVLTHFPDIVHKIQVIYNGADQLVLKEDYTPIYKPQKPFLFTLGVVRPKKNFHVLPALLANNDFELIIAGIDSNYRNRILEEAKRFNCIDRVKIIGPISEGDKAWYYKNCLAFVFPSIAEGFGLPVIEAMHFGKPVFLSTHTSLPEIGGKVAYYFNSFDPADMQSVFLEGLNDYQNNNSQNAIIEHASQFSWERAANEYLQLYGDCLSDSM